MPIFKLSVAGGLIYWLVRSERFDLAKLSALKAPEVWGVGLLVMLLMLLINSKRWQILLAFEDVQVSFVRAFNLSLIGLFFNFFVPGGVGGDVVKGSYLMRDHKDKKWFIGWSILIDRVFGVLALLLYSSVTGVLFYQRLQPELRSSFFSLSLTLLLLLVSLLALLIFSPKQKIARLLKSQAWADQTLTPLFYFFRQPRRVLLPFLLSLASQGLVIALGAYLSWHLALPIAYWVILLIFPFGFLATVIPISPAGIGVGQAAFYYLFDRVVSQGAFGVLTITFLQAVQFVIGLFGGLLFIFYGREEGARNFAKR